MPGTPYLPNWHIDAIVHQLMRVQAGDISRLLINQPPRSLKSICVSVAYVAWLLGHDPSRRVIVVSYANEFAAELHRQFRMVIDAPWYRALFPAMRPARDSGTELVTTAGGGRYATSVGGTLTGRGADLIIIDDPLKAEEAMSEAARKRVIDWYAGTLVSRLNDKENGPIVVVMQRLHENDLAGHLLDQGGWEHLDLPAIALDDSVIPLGHGKVMTRRVGDILHPERESKEALDRIKAEIGSLMFSAQYQQRPIPLEGNLIRRDWFRYYDPLPQELAQAHRAELGHRHDDGRRQRLFRLHHLADDQSGLLPHRRVPRPPSIPCPSAQSRQSRGQAWRRNHPDRECRPRHGASAGSPARSAAGHATPASVGNRREAKRIAWWPSQPRLKQGTSISHSEADWLDTFLLELLAFPNGRHDDQVDSVSQFLNWASLRKFLDGNMLVGMGAKVFRDGVQINCSE